MASESISPSISVSPSDSVSPSGSVSPSASISRSISPSPSASPSAAEKSYALTTPERICAYMNITAPTGAKMALLINMINSVTEFVENYLGRRLKKTAYTAEKYDTELAETLDLKQYPVDSSATFYLERRTSSQNVDEWEIVDSEYYHVDYTNGIIESAGGLRFSRTVQGYRVTYTAGYDFDNEFTFLSDTRVGEIELAVWMLLDYVWNNSAASESVGTGVGGGGIQSERIGDYAITYAKATMFNEDIKSILDRYAGVNGTSGGGVGVLGPLTPFQG
jgi:hypothetical protein